MKKRTAIISSIVAFSCLSIAFLPSFLSTNIGSRVLSQILSEKTEHQVHLKGDFSWFSPQKIQTLHVASSQFILDIDDITVDQGMLSLLFSKTPLVIDVESSSLFWQKNTLIQKKQASIFLYNLPFFLPQSIRLNLKNGSILQGQDAKKVLEKVSGFFELKNSDQLQGDLQGSSLENGSLALHIDLDIKKMDGTFDLSVKNCSKDALFDFPLKEKLSDRFDLTLSYLGNLEEGLGDIYVAFENLNLSTSFTLKNQVLFSKNPLFLDFKTTNVIQNGYQIEELSLDLTASHFSFDLASKKIDALDFNGDLFLKKFTLHDHLYGDVTLKAFTKKNGNLFDGQITCLQNEQAILEAFCQNVDLHLSQGNLSVKATQFPLKDFEAIAPLGHTLNGKLDMHLADQKAHFVTDIQTDAIQKLIASGSFTPDVLTIKSLDSLITKEGFDYALKNTSFVYDLKKQQASGLNIEGILNTQDPHLSLYFPLTIQAQGETLQKIDLKIDSKNVTLDGPFSLDLHKKTIKILNGMQGRLFFDPKQMHQVNLDPIKASFVIKSGSSLENMDLDITLEPIKRSSDQDYILSLGKIALNADILKKSANGSFFAQICGLNHKGELEGSFKALNQKIQTLNLKVDNPPLEAFSYGSDDFKKAAAFFGKGLKILLNYQDTLQEKLMDVDIQSENIKCQTAFSLSDYLTLKKKGFIDLKIYDLDFPFISYKPPFELKKPAVIRLDLDSLNLDLKNPDIQTIGLNGTLRIMQLYLSKNKANLQLEGFLGKLEKNINDTRFSFSSSGDLFSSFDKNITTGHLALNLQSSGLLGKFHHLDFSNFKLQSQLKLDQLPTLILDFLLSKEKFPITESLGPTLNGSIEIDHTNDTGTIKSLLHANEALFKFNAQKKGNLYSLTEDAMCQFNLSSELSKVFFEKRPLGIEKMASDQLIAFRLKQNGTKFSLFPFKTSDLSFDDLKIDLGKIELVAEDIIPQLLAILKASRSKNVSIWFQPIKLSVNKGFCTLDRFDFLLQDRFQIALWGQVDLNKEILGLILGLPSLTLQRAFGITNLPSDYVVQVPISGTFENVQIDSKSAATKIGLILALQKGGGLVEKFGGKQGGAIGGMMKSLSRLPDFDKKAPPANTPFPWDSNKEKSDEPKSRKKKVSSKDSPTKQLMKMFF